MGIASGGIGAICGNPADVALVRMTVDNRLPVEQRRNYTSGKFLPIELNRYRRGLETCPQAKTLNTRVHF